MKVLFLSGYNVHSMLLMYSFVFFLGIYDVTRLCWLEIARCIFHKKHFVGQQPPAEVPMNSSTFEYHHHGIGDEPWP